MAECLLIVEEQGVHTAAAHRTECGPSVDEIDGAVELGCTVESIDEQIGDAGIQRSHLEVHRDGQLIGDVDEVQIEQLTIR